MSISAVFGSGSYFVYNNIRVYEVKKIAGIPIDNSEIDVTDLDSPAREFKPKLKDNGSFELEVNYLGNDAGQEAMLEDSNNSTVPTRAWELHLSGGIKTITGNGYIKNFTFGDSAPDETIPAKITIRITGATSLSAPDLSGMTCVISDGSPLNLAPNFTSTSYHYVATATSNITVTPTKSGATFVVTCGSSSQALASGATSSSITVAAGSVVTVTVKATLTSSGLSSNYTFTIGRDA